MSGAVCLQGGAEFGDRCRSMDEGVLRLAGGGPVVIVAAANESAHDHDTTIAEAVAYYASLGATEVHGTPDVLADPTEALSRVRDAALVVLPGGSPGRSLEALMTTGLGDALRELVAAGGVVSGSSAGAMTLCEWTLVRVGGGVELRAGVGVVPGALVLPHFAGGRGWLDAVSADLDPDVTVLGVPECSGVVAEGPGLRRVSAVGAAPTTLLGARDEQLALGASVDL